MALLIYDFLSLSAIVSIALSYAIFEISDVEEYIDLEI